MVTHIAYCCPRTAKPSLLTMLSDRVAHSTCLTSATMGCTVPNGILGLAGTLLTLQCTHLTLECVCVVHYGTLGCLQMTLG